MYKSNRLIKLIESIIIIKNFTKNQFNSIDRTELILIFFFFEKKLEILILMKINVAMGRRHSEKKTRVNTPNLWKTHTHTPVSPM